MIAALEADGDFRVLRRLSRRREITPNPGVPVKRAVFLDLETTGTDPALDEIIEIAMVPFTYGEDGTIYEVGEAFQAFRQPSKPISALITRLTGITNDMVEGHVIDPAEVSSFLADVVVVIAHNAAFDRRFLEAFCESAALKAWACSMSQVDWAGAGYEGTKLAYLAQSAGFFYDSHRAFYDCLAGIELLSRPLGASGRPAMAQLLETARRPTWRIWAEGAPFDLKDQLKARGYRWNAEGGATPRAWFIDAPDKDAELDFLQREIYQGEIRLLAKRVTAFDRFSDRI